LDAAHGIPGVMHASPRVSVPFWGSYGVSLYVAGIDSVRRLGRFDLNAVGGDYFATMGTRVLRGRGISDHDVQGAPRVMVVSDSMAKTLWPGRDALGQCIRVRFETAPCTYVVGVAENIKAERLGDDPTFYYYLSAAQWDPQNGGLFVRMAGPAARSAEMVRRRLQQTMPGASYVSVMPFAEILGNETRSWQLGATMFLVFGGLALALAAIGLYSVMAYNVTQRVHELGVRAALGAQQGDLVRLVLGDGLKVGTAGIVIGVVIALVGGQWIAPLLFQVSPHDPLVFAVVSLTLLAVTVLASVFPSRRASRVDPMVALRSE
jgi:putative ABC transport system permease protein